MNNARIIFSGQFLDQASKEFYPMGETKQVKSNNSTKHSTPPQPNPNAKPHQSPGVGSSPSNGGNKVSSEDLARLQQRWGK